MIYAEVLGQYPKETILKKLLLFTIITLTSLSSYASKNYCLSDNESEGIFVYSNYQNERIWHVEDSYQGDEIGHLKNGKKTYFLYGSPNHFIDNRIPLRGEFKENAFKAGMNKADTLFGGQVIFVTQDEEVLDFILSAAPNNGTSLCVYGSHLISNETLSILDHSLEKNYFKSIEIRDNKPRIKFAYQVIEKVQIIDCMRPLTWTEADVFWGKAINNTNIEAPEYLDTTVIANCTDFSKSLH